MSNKKQNAKHTVGKGADREKYNADGEESYVKDPKESKSENHAEEGNYLEQKWKKISSDFRSKYNIDIEDSEFRKNSFSDIAEKLESKTGKSRLDIEKEIKEWKDS
jgi:hypothetical protein